jgi:predicted HD superfamily hydrolase involved in NAD metabolism
MLTIFPYISHSVFTGDIITDVEALFVANNKAKTFIHSKAVAEANIQLAEQYGLDKDICELGGYLHDISAVISPKDMLSYAVENNWYIDEAEQKYPVLLHQRISRVIAQNDFGITDERILSAVEHHTTLKVNPSEYDMALFVADKLAWQESYDVPVSKAPFYTVVSDALKQSLELASLAYMDYIVEHKMILHPHKWFEDGRDFLRCIIKTK